ncbi:MAG: aspartyl protease family protein [Hyphococcus sp.]
MHRLLFSIAIFCLLMPVRLMAAEPLATVPYKIDFNGWYTIDVNVNGEGPYQFIVDTGATLTAVYQNLADDHAFAPAETGEKRVLGIIGAQSLPAIEVDTITLGGLSLDNHTSVVIPDWTRTGPIPAGVLGLDFLARYTVFFDAERQVIEFYPPGAPPSGKMAEMTRTGLRYSTFNRDYGGLYTIIVNMGGRRIPCIVDLGADGTLINYGAMRRLMGGIYVDPHRDTGTTTGTKIRDVFGDEARARTIEVRIVRIGGARWTRQRFLVYSAGIFDALGLNNRSYGLLGADLLRDRNFIFDFANERFYISKKSVVTAS